MTTVLPDNSSIETRFVCVNKELKIGSVLDGLQVVWCQPGRKRILWHVMLLRRQVYFRGCCD